MITFHRTWKINQTLPSQGSLMAPQMTKDDLKQSCQMNLNHTGVIIIIKDNDTRKLDTWSYQLANTPIFFGALKETYNAS